MTTPAFPRIGVTVDQITAALTPTPITDNAGYTVVVVDNGGSTSNSVELPSGSDIGDVVELYRSSSSGAFLAKSATGETTNLGSALSVNAVLVVRKTSSMEWSVLSIG